MNFIKAAILVIAAAMLFTKPIYSQQQPDPYLAFAQVMPQPVGGLTAIYKRITYPDAARSAHVEGKVYLLIYIDEEGKVDNVKVLKGIGMGCDEAAVRAVKEEAFTPATNNGVKVKVKLAMPINFQLGG